MGFGFMVLEYKWCTKYFYGVPFFLILATGRFWKRKLAEDVTGIFTNGTHAVIEKLIQSSSVTTLIC